MHRRIESMMIATALRPTPTASMAALPVWTTGAYYAEHARATHVPDRRSECETRSAELDHRDPGRRRRAGCRHRGGRVLLPGVAAEGLGRLPRGARADECQRAGHEGPGPTDRGRLSHGENPAFGSFRRGRALAPGHREPAPRDDLPRSAERAAEVDLRPHRARGRRPRRAHRPGQRYHAEGSTR